MKYLERWCKKRAGDIGETCYGWSIVSLKCLTAAGGKGILEAEWKKINIYSGKE